MGIRGRAALAATLTAAAVTGTASTAGTARGDVPCSQRPYNYVANDKDRNATYGPNEGTRVYTLYLHSYLFRCHGVTYIRHGLYFDTRALNYGHPIQFRIRTRRSDGSWAYAGPIRQIEAKQKIQEALVYQRRRTGGHLRITRVEVRHCGCSIGSGQAPIGSTAHGTYVRYYGPSAGPKK